MKKMLMLAAVAVMGFAANAAAVTWNTGTLYLPNTDGSWSSTKATGSTAGSWQTVVTLYANDLTSGSNAKGDVIATTGNSSTSMGNLGYMSGSLALASGDAWSGNTTYWIDAVITYTSAAGTQTMDTLEGYFTVKPTGTTTVNFQATTALNQKIVGSGITSFTAVPEPTSGLLLLLGMAGLALKRKIA